MYEVYIKNGNATKYIHLNATKLGSGQIVKGINTIDTFSFTIYPNNDGYNDLYELKTLVFVFNRKTNKEEFSGRVLKSKVTMDASGLIYKEIICESFLGFLNDTVQEYVTLRNWTVNELLTEIINKHNSQTESYKRFTIGTVTATDPNDNLYLHVDRVKTWDALNDYLIKKIGGEIRVRNENGTLYLDYLDKIGETKATEIKVRHNMQSVTRDRDASAFITRLIPLGAKIVDEDGNETEERVTISSVNDGKDYIDDVLGVENYGVIVNYEFWDDVNTPAILKTKAINWLAENNRVKQQITTDAVELALIGLDIDYIDVYNYYPVKNELVGIDDTLRVVKKTINILSPSTSNVDFGDTLKSLTQMQVEKDKEISKAVENSNKVEALENKVNYLEKTQGENALIVDEELEEIRQEIVTATTEISQTTDELILGAVSELVSTGEFDTFKNEVSARLNITSDEINIKFADALTQIETLENETKTSFETLESYIRGYMNDSGQPVLELGSAQSLIMLRLENDRIAFLQNGIEVAYISNNTLYITDGTFLNSLRIGNFAFIPRANGSLDFKKVT